MNTAFYTGVSGLIAYQEHMNTTAHNISNSNTAGYKPGVSSFSDLMYTQMDVRTEGDKVEGHGVKYDKVNINMNQAGLNLTNRPLDFAIVGDGFFALEDGDGNVKYSRNGALGLGISGKNAFLVSASDGSYVLDAKGKRIKLPYKEDGKTVDTSGLEQKIGIFTFPNKYGLERADGSSFTETNTSGKAYSITGSDQYELRGGALEFSGVQLSDEMINVIQAQRAYQMNSKIITTADQMEELINNLRN